MTTSRLAGWHRLASRAAAAGMFLGLVALAVGLFIVLPLSDHTASDSSASSQAALVLIVYGPVAAMASAGLWAGEALLWWARGRRVGRPRARADGNAR